MQSEVARGDAASIDSKICCPIIVSGSCSLYDGHAVRLW